MLRLGCGPYILQVDDLARAWWYGQNLLAWPDENGDALVAWFWSRC
jgi:hypothetical protein